VEAMEKKRKMIQEGKTELDDFSDEEEDFGFGSVQRENDDEPKFKK
jgi:hypothetical protein